jgi:TonB family protein
MKTGNQDNCNQDNRDQVNRNQVSTGIAALLVRHAARRAPAPLAERLEEEWLADLGEQKKGAARIHFALGCWWARHVIAAEALELGAPAAQGAAGHGTLAAFVPQDPVLFSRRTLVVMAIVAAHVGAYYAFTSGLVAQIFDGFPPPIVVQFVDKARPDEPIRKLPGPNLSHTTSDDAKQNFKPMVETLGDPPIEVGTTEPTVPPGPQEPPARHINRVSGGPGRGFPSTEEYYPGVSRSLGETGAAAVQVCVDASGRLLTDPAIVTSSGSARLDAGALALARAGSGHYRSTTEDGKPVNSCYPFRVRFTLGS